MSDASALILAAKDGDSASLHRLLVDLQRSLRLTAALFLPAMRDVDAVVQRLGTVVVDSLDSAPVDDPMPWLQGHLRTLIAQHLDELERSPAYAGDPLGRMLLSSGRERLGKIPLDIDPVKALNGRLRLMTKGALDLLVLRFTNGLPLVQIANQRLLSMDDVSNGLQTACRQLDWLNQASGDALEPQDYRALDGLVCGSETTSEGLGFLRTRLLDDMTLALRVVLAARVHMAAAAWFSPALTIELRSLSRTSAVHLPTRRRSNPAITSRIKRNRGFSTPTRRQLALRGDSGSYSVEAYPERRSRSGLIPTLIGGALVLGGVLLLLLRDGSSEVRTTKPVVAPNTNPAQQSLPPPTPPQVSTPTPTPKPEPTAPNQAPLPVPSLTPTAPVTTLPEGVATKSLFVPGMTPAPVAVWSTRLLVSDYRGPLLRLRRSNDHAEQDVGVLADGSLDTATMMSFTGNHSAHVMVWYDQSGNKHHLRQPERDKQPRIISDGAMEVENSRPVMNFDRTRFEHFSTPAVITLGCLYAVVKVRVYEGATQGLFGSPAKGTKNYDAYYPLLDRTGSGRCEWWLGNPAYGKNAVITTIPRDRLLLWHSSSDGNTKPTLVLRLDGKQIGSTTCSSGFAAPIGPTVVGCVYWSHGLADPFGGMLGEMFVLPPGSSDNLREAIYQKLKMWWKTP